MLILNGFNLPLVAAFIGGDKLSRHFNLAFFVVDARLLQGDYISGRN